MYVVVNFALTTDEVNFNGFHFFSSATISVKKTMVDACCHLSMLDSHMLCYSYPENKNNIILVSFKSILNGIFFMK